MNLYPSEFYFVKLPFGTPHGGLVLTLSRKSSLMGRAGGKVRATCPPPGFTRSPTSSQAAVSSVRVTAIPSARLRNQLSTTTAGNLSMAAPPCSPRGFRARQPLRPFILTDELDCSNMRFLKCRNYLEVIQLNRKWGSSINTNSYDINQ